MERGTKKSKRTFEADVKQKAIWGGTSWDMILISWLLKIKIVFLCSWKTTILEVVHILEELVSGLYIYNFAIHFNSVHFSSQLLLFKYKHLCNHGSISVLPKTGSEKFLTDDEAQQEVWNVSDLSDWLLFARGKFKSEQKPREAKRLRKSYRWLRYYCWNFSGLL